MAGAARGWRSVVGPLSAGHGALRKPCGPGGSEVMAEQQGLPSLGQNEAAGGAPSEGAWGLPDAGLGEPGAPGRTGSPGCGCVE